MEISEEKAKSLLDQLNNPIDSFDAHIGSLLEHDDPLQGHGPKAGMLYVKFSEDEPNVDQLAKFLWGQCMYYAIPKSKREKLRRKIEADFSEVANINTAVRQSFIELRQSNTSRASEFGEVLAYCIAQRKLGAAQIASKMALKTSGNMPVHGLDGVHAAFSGSSLTVYFLESKVAGGANSGIEDYIDSAKSFLANKKQYFKEYDLIGDLSNLDALTGSDREYALSMFDIIGNPSTNRRERFVGVVCYTEKLYGNTIPVSDTEPPSIHDDHFRKIYSSEHARHQKRITAHGSKHKVNLAKMMTFLVAVPDVNSLRLKFYENMGVKLDPNDIIDQDESADEFEEIK